MEKLISKFSYPKEKPEMEVNLGPDWFMNAKELDELVTKEMVVLELGAFFGRSTLFFANKTKRVFTVDTWLGSIGEHDGDVDVCMDMYNQFIVNTWNMQHRISPIRAYSHVAMQYLQNAKFVPDLVYVDAGHTYNDVSRDLMVANNFPKSTIICGDDYGHGCDNFGIRKAVNEFVNAFGYKLRVERDWFYEIIR